MATPAQIQKIHVLIKKLNIPDDVYREILSEYNVKSSIDLKFEHAKDFIDKLVSRCNTNGIPSSSCRSARPGLATKAQIAMLYAMWQQVSTVPVEQQREAFGTFVKNRWRVDRISWLPMSDVGKIKKTLEAMGATHGHKQLQA
jgi:hypothetical protein